MASKFGKFVLFTTVAAAAAAGVYHYMQGKNKAAEDFDDFDDFDDIDDIDDETEDVKDDSKRNYVSLDSAKSFVSDTASKAKDAATKVGKKIKSSIEDAKNKKEVPEEESEQSTEEFFDDDEV